MVIIYYLTTVINSLTFFEQPYIEQRMDGWMDRQTERTIDR